MNTDHLRLLSHNLSNYWSSIHWATHILRDKRLTQPDRQLYEEMLSRNVAAIHALLPPLLHFFKPSESPETLFTALAALLDQHQLQETSTSLAQLESLMGELKQLIMKLVQ